MKNKAENYVRKEIIKLAKLNPSGNEAYLWLVKQIKYYKKPEYMQTDYTKYVLLRMQDIISKFPKDLDEKSINVTLVLLSEPQKNTG